MDAQGHLGEAIVAELQRQAANAPAQLEVQSDSSSSVTVRGRVLDELSAAIMGALAGGP
jgi:hypothetical protein